MVLRMHPDYQQLVDQANRSHEQNRNPQGISAEDICLARLYCYAFRKHVIGVFHATRVAIEQQSSAGTLSVVLRRRSIECLDDLANLSMEPVPTDYRVVISMFHRYHNGVLRIIDSIESEAQALRDPKIARIADLFHKTIEGITTSCGICPSQDIDVPEQASFVVPGLGIIIVPLVYGDHHSWNLAYLAGEFRDVPIHRHSQGVEIHLGYNPTHGITVLGNCRAPVKDGYAMPIPPETDHGWVNTGDHIHHVPFIFGSLIHSGWGVFLDVAPRPCPLEDLQLVDRDSVPFSQMVYLERQIDRAAAMTSSWHSTLIPHTVTNRNNSGGLTLGITRIDPAGYTFPRDDFRIVAVVRGQCRASIERIECDMSAHDHFGIPMDMSASLKQVGPDPLVVLDTMIK